MCCHTNQCCCGCMDMKAGITMAGFIDLFLLLVLGTLNAVFLHNYGAFWSVIVVIADMLLICGAMSNSPGLLVFWLIICMINIVFLFIGWIALPLMIVLGSFCSEVNENEDFWYGSGPNNDVPYHYGTTTRTICGDTIQIGLIVTAAFVFILPIYYLYLWIIVKSHRENLVRQQSIVQPIQQNPNPQIFIVANGPMQPTNQQVLVGQNPMYMYNQPIAIPTQQQQPIQQYQPELGYYKM